MALPEETQLALENAVKSDFLIAEESEFNEDIVPDASGFSNSSTPEVTIGHVLELLLSAACLHKNATTTISALLKSHEGAKLLGDSKAVNAASPGSTCLPLGFNKSGATSDISKEPNVSGVEIWSRLLDNPATAQPEMAMKILTDIIQEGMLDSILPYVVSSLNLNSDFASNPFPLMINGAPKALSESCRKSGIPSSTEKDRQKEQTRQSRSNSRLTAESRRNSEEEERDPTDPQQLYQSEGKQESIISTYFPELNHDQGPPIVIHVCDEAHGLRQDFSCPRDLLITHIGYFADVTAGQRLEDVDISVHCDVSIFDWLLKWVRKHESPKSKDPILEPKNCVSVLISADFLKMSPLAEEVLNYVHDNANQILEAQVNLSCLTDSLLTKLSRLFTHWELETLKDPRDRLQNRLYARLVQCLCDLHPQPARGIYRTAATIYRCSDCEKMVNKTTERLTDCVPSNTCVTTSGCIYYVHSRDLTWSLTEHVRQLKNDLKSWRQVYWRLWGQVHFLPCSTCGVVFPGTEMKLCRHHKIEPNFGVENLNAAMSSSGDIYPCCGARALRFTPLPLRNGCEFAEHTVQLTQKHQDVWGPVPQIYDDLLSFQVLICIEPPTMDAISQKVVWKGVPLIPSVRHERSFLDRSWLGEQRDRNLPETVVNVETESRCATPPDASEVPVVIAEEVSAKMSSDRESESSEDEEEGVKKKGTLAGKIKTTLIRRAAKAKRTVVYDIANEPGWRWDSTRSTRHNQDAQRERETKILRELTAWLSLAAPAASDAGLGAKNKSGKPDKKKDYLVNGPDAGAYYRLEAEFKEKFGSIDKSHHSSNAGSIFRAKVQAISRIKMRLRHRTAFSATR